MIKIRKLPDRKAEKNEAYVHYWKYYDANGRWCKNQNIQIQKVDEIRFCFGVVKSSSNRIEFHDIWSGQVGLIWAKDVDEGLRILLEQAGKCGTFKKPEFLEQEKAFQEAVRKFDPDYFIRKLAGE